MADEKDPNLDPANHSADEESPREDVAATPKAEDPGEPDPETRMLDQLAQLDDHDDQLPADDGPTENASATADAPNQPEIEPQPADEPAEPTTQRTAVLTPISGEPAHDSATTQQQSKKRRWPWVVAAVVALIGVGYVGLAFATQDTLPATLTVEGVDVSGMSVEEAAPVLEDEFAARAQRDMTVTVEEADDVTATVVPADAGYTYDVDATLDNLTDLTFDPVALWSRIFGEAHVSAVTDVDEAVVDETLAGLDEQLSYEPTEGSLVYEGADIDYTAPVTGFTLDQDALAGQLDDQWLSETEQLVAPGDVEDPVVAGEQWDQFITDTAEPLVADVYTVTAGETSTELTPAQLGSAAEVRLEAAAEGTETADTVSSTDQSSPAEPEESPSDDAVADTIVLHLDDEALTDALAENNSAFESTNQDATIQLTGSAGSARPEVVPGSTGRGVDGAQVVDEMLTDLNGEQTRTITVELHEIEPEITTEDAEAWDVNHVVAEYATPYPPQDGPRTANLRIGADRVNGTVVMPGEEFNLNSLLAPVNEANGYQPSGVVESGVTSTAVGGGLSQIATMSYNAGFLGGMDIVEHKPHSRWFDRYPQGRESTYWEGQINVRWANDTDAPVIVEMWLAGNQVHTRLWGSDYYDVSTSTSEPYNHTASPTIRSNDDECVAERGGREGFTVDVHRTKTPPSGSPVSESWSWAYSGWPTVICE